MKAKTMQKIILISTILLITSCQTSAPSNYELNRRSGLGLEQDQGVTPEQSVDKDLSAIRTSRLPAKSAQMPARLPPIVEKVWVYDQIINDGEWMQGTWVFVEVESAKWLPEVDSGSGSFIDTGKVGIKKVRK
ncbi:MAG: hypothetical protein EOP04_03625 [Proteobacteria bacterium]|nr:MAG: hypothetical protein EOP04_03625 [Pseudomonadota bacterium]